MKDKTPAIDFLLYSYFEITSDCKRDEMIDACIKRAYLDTCRRINFPLPAAQKKDEAKGQYFYEHTVDVLRKRIEQLSEQDYDQWHKETCEAVIKMGCADDIRNFYQESIVLTYGHAQKWVNMTMKYLYLLEQLLEKGYVSCNWSKLHVPIDSFIMESIYKDIELPGREHGRSFDKVKKLKFDTAQSDDLLPWSKWEQKGYEGVYQKIRSHAQKGDENICPLVWENSAWIKVAKSRKK